MLNTGRTVEHWHTRTKTGEVPILERLSPRAWLEMNPRDARALRLKTTDRGGRGLAARSGAAPRAAAHRDGGAGSGVRAVSLGGVQRQPGDAERVRSDLAGAQLQAVRRARGTMGGRSAERRYGAGALVPGRSAMSEGNGNGGTLVNAGKRKLVVVGNGMAGARVVEEILKRAPDRFDIVMFGAEPYGNYNRILLSNVLNGSQSATDIFMNPLSWYRDNGIRLHAGVKATRIDRERRVVVGTPLRKDALAYSADAAAETGAPRRRGTLRPRHHRDRLAAVRAADGGLRRTGHVPVPHHRRLRAHRRLRQREAGARRSSAAVCWDSKRRAGC